MGLKRLKALLPTGVLLLVPMLTLFVVALPISRGEEQEEAGKPINHLVKKKETLYGIMVKKYKFRGMEFRSSIPKFKELNPRIKNINIIFYGFRILIPPKSLALGPGRSKGPTSTSGVVASVPEGLTLKAPQEGLKPGIKLEQVSDFNLKEAAEEIFPKMGIALINAGDTAFELSRYGQVRVDNRRFPIIQMPGSKNLILDYEGNFPGDLKKLLETNWPDYRVVAIDSKTGLKGLVEKVFSDSRYFSVSRNQTVTFGDEAKLILKGDWKIESTRESILKGKVTLLNLVEEGFLPAPQFVKDYARDFGIEVIELTRNRTGAPPAGATGSPEGILVTASSQDNSALARQLLETVNQEFEAKKPVKLKGAPTAGLEVNFVADKFLEKGGATYVIDYSQLPRELVSFARDFGIKVISIGQKDSFKEVVGKVYGALDIPHTFSNYRVIGDLQKVPSYFDVEVPGVLVKQRTFGLKRSKDGSDSASFPFQSDYFLLTNARMNPTLEKILEERGYAIKRTLR